MWWVNRHTHQLLYMFLKTIDLVHLDIPICRDCISLLIFDKIRG